jgi:hypothetical protein
MEEYCRVAYDTDDNIKRRMRFAYWVIHAKTHTKEYVIVIAFPRQYWLCEHA